jgi:hypothetical protein
MPVPAKEQPRGSCAAAAAPLCQQLRPRAKRSGRRRASESKAALTTEELQGTTYSCVTLKYFAIKLPAGIGVESGGERPCAFLRSFLARRSHRTTHRTGLPIPIPSAFGMLVSSSVPLTGGAHDTSSSEKALPFPAWAASHNSVAVDSTPLRLLTSLWFPFDSGDTWEWSGFKNKDKTKVRKKLLCYLAPTRNANHNLLNHPPWCVRCSFQCV